MVTHNQMFRSSQMFLYTGSDFSWPDPIKRLISNDVETSSDHLIPHFFLAYLMLHATCMLVHILFFKILFYRLQMVRLVYYNPRNNYTKLDRAQREAFAQAHLWIQFDTIHLIAIVVLTKSVLMSFCEWWPFVFAPILTWICLLRKII